MKQLLRTLIITASILLFGNCYAQQDSICFDYNDGRKILILANKGKQVDSLIYFYDSRVDILNEIIEHKDGQLDLARQLISEQSIQIADLKAKLAEADRRRNRLKTGLLIISGIAVTELIIILLP